MLSCGAHCPQRHRTPPLARRRGGLAAVGAAPMLAAALLGAPAKAQERQEEVERVDVAAEGDATPQVPSWVDSSHDFASSRAQALAQWLDDFFGVPVRDAERADTFIRIIALDDWNARDDHNVKLRLRGQIRLPKVSERVDLVFSGEENEQTLSENERSDENDIGLRFNFTDDNSLRFDATLSLRSGPSLLPGLRARYQQSLNEDLWYRLTQRLQYDTSDGYRALTNVDVNMTLDEQTLLRWGARMRYREDEGYWDWNTGVTWRRWIDDHERHPSAVEAYFTISGRDDPRPFNSDYRIGLLYREQFFRDFFFVEIEPNYNWRKDTRRSGRSGVAGIVLRVEMMLGELD